MTITINFINQTTESVKFVVDKTNIQENVKLSNIAFTGTFFQIYFNQHDIFKNVPVLYGTVPYIEEETPTDRTYVITLSEGQNFTQGWAE